MDAKEIIIPAVVVGLLGAFFAVVLAYVSKKFHVPKDEKVDEIADLLPGLNCGGCGFPSCRGYAESVYYHDHVPLTFCKPGGSEVAKKLAEALGREVAEVEREVAKVHCRGGKERAKLAFAYSGIERCSAANLLKGGQYLCKDGCLGFGDCKLACTFNAIEMGEDGLPVIDRDKCTACGACVKACPKGLIKLIPQSKRVFVECSNRSNGASVVKICDVGCIACGLCVKECPFDAIHIVDNVAVIDYEKCKSCGKCAKVCPRGIILVLPRVWQGN